MWVKRTHSCVVYAHGDVCMCIYLVIAKKKTTKVSYIKKTTLEWEHCQGALVANWRYQGCRQATRVRARSAAIRALEIAYGSLDGIVQDNEGQTAMLRSPTAVVRHGCSTDDSFGLEKAMSFSIKKPLNHGLWLFLPKTVKIYPAHQSRSFWCFLFLPMRFTSVTWCNNRGRDYSQCWCLKQGRALTFLRKMTSCFTALVSLDLNPSSEAAYENPVPTGESTKITLLTCKSMQIQQPKIEKLQRW